MPVRRLALALAFVFATLWAFGKDRPIAPLHERLQFATAHVGIEFAPDGALAAITHDWVFDEVFSSGVVDTYAPKGKRVDRVILAPLAEKNAATLGQGGYFTTLKIDGEPMQFAPATDYWMEERPDGLVAFHFRLELKTPRRIHRFGSVQVADPTNYFGFEFTDVSHSVTLDHAPKGCTATLQYWPIRPNSGESVVSGDKFVMIACP